MSYLNDGKPFRMPSSWYDPPEPDYWTCPVCKAEEQVEEECEECKEPRPDLNEDPDPDRAYDEMRERRWEED